MCRRIGDDGGRPLVEPEDCSPPPSSGPFACDSFCLRLPMLGTAFYRYNSQCLSITQADARTVIRKPQQSMGSIGSLSVSCSVCISGCVTQAPLVFMMCQDHCSNCLVQCHLWSLWRASTCPVQNREAATGQWVAASSTEDSLSSNKAPAGQML